MTVGVTELVMVRVRIAVNVMGENDAKALGETDALGERDGEPLSVIPVV